MRQLQKLAVAGLVALCSCTGTTDPTPKPIDTTSVSVPPAFTVTESVVTVRMHSEVCIPYTLSSDGKVSLPAAGSLPWEWSVTDDAQNKCIKVHAGGQVSDEAKQPDGTLVEQFYISAKSKDGKAGTLPQLLRIQVLKPKPNKGCAHNPDTIYDNKTFNVEIVCDSIFVIDSKEKVVTGTRFKLGLFRFEGGMVVLSPNRAIISAIAFGPLGPKMGITLLNTTTNGVDGGVVCSFNLIYMAENPPKDPLDESCEGPGLRGINGNLLAGLSVSPFSWKSDESRGVKFDQTTTTVGK
jgi:hypothetical protein